MRYVVEAVTTRHACGPRLHFLCRDLFRAPALAAHQVMVVIGLVTEAKHRLSDFILEDVEIS
jgi:hypothetical protein